MDVKFGKVKSGNNLFIVPSSNNMEGNFFAAGREPKKEKEQNKPNNSPLATPHRINDYDSNILQNNAYQTISDEIFKTEQRMERLEQLISKLTTEIETLENLGYDIQVNNLKQRKQKAEEELIELNQKYTELSLSSKFSGQIAAAVNISSRKMNIFLKIRKFFSRRILSKLSKKFNYKQTINDALDSLSDINTNIDELIKLQTPYGESVTRYEKLTAYLNKANVLHSQINKNVNAMTKKKP